VKTYRQTLAYLYGLQTRGMKFGLTNTRRLLSSLGNPHTRFESIHVAGTNGKGSTSSFLASIFMEGGLKTGLYTSPHLVHFTERIKINGEEIPQDRLVSYTKELRQMIDEVKATFFEATTALAFRYFADERVDIAIIETGLGGRLDATNLLIPRLSIITNVSYDHMEYLGSTIESIAREKAGIIKKGRPCIVGRLDEPARKVISRIAKRRSTHVVGAQKRVILQQSQRTGLSRFIGKNVSFSLRSLGLGGKHQWENARLAVAAIDVYLSSKKRGRFRQVLSSATIRRGLEKVCENTALRGRLETSGRFDRCILDVAHNPSAIEELVTSLGVMRGHRMVVVFGVMKKKAYGEMLFRLSAIARLLILVKPKTPRACDLRLLARKAGELNIPVRLEQSVARGLKVARQLARRNERVLVTGSHFVVGEAIVALDEQNT
jgi:dihydrofolate synthase / folylpolyglutamate synthase